MNARIYLVNFGEVAYLVKATSQAQALRRLTRDLMTCRPAHSLEVAEMMQGGRVVIDATSEAAIEGQEVMQ